MNGYRDTVVDVLYKDNEFFLIQKEHWPGYWNFVQGGIEKGGNGSVIEAHMEGRDPMFDAGLLHAAVRELREETSGDYQIGSPYPLGVVEPIPISPASKLFYPDKGNRGKMLYFVAIPLIGQKSEVGISSINESSRIVDSTWATRERALDLLYEGVRPIADMAFYRVLAGYVQMLDPLRSADEERAIDS